MPVKTIIEPFLIKSFELMRWTTSQERMARLQAARYNLFLLHAHDLEACVLARDDRTGYRPPYRPNIWAELLSLFRVLGKYLPMGKNHVSQIT